jgi:hypothetical protein
VKPLCRPYAGASGLIRFRNSRWLAASIARVADGDHSNPFTLLKLPREPTGYRAFHRGTHVTRNLVLESKEKGTGMPDVKHMKWCGWGVEGVCFHHEDKPAFRPLLINAIDLDVNTRPAAPMSLVDLPIPAPMISDQLLGELIDAVGADNVVQDDLHRIVHTYGKSATICCESALAISRGCQTSWSIRAMRRKGGSLSIAPSRQML